MKSKKGIDIVTSVGTRLYDAFVNASTSGMKRVVTTVGTGDGPNQMAMQNDTTIVDAISASGGRGLPTEDAVVNFVNANKGAKMSFQASIGSNIKFAVPHNATHIIYSGIPFDVVINSISYSNVHILFKFGPNGYSAPAVMIRSDGSVSAKTDSSFTTLRCSSGSGIGNYIYKVSFEN